VEPGPEEVSVTTVRGPEGVSVTTARGLSPLRGAGVRPPSRLLSHDNRPGAALLERVRLFWNRHCPGSKSLMQSHLRAPSPAPRRGERTARTPHCPLYAPPAHSCRESLGVDRPTPAILLKTREFRLLFPKFRTRIVLPSSSAGRSGAWSGRPWARADPREGRRPFLSPLHARE